MPTVLLVEDVEECQTVVKRALASSSYRMMVANTLGSARDLLKENSATPVDLVILDLGLPDGEGIVLLEEIRQKHGDSVPVILLTSHDELDSKVTAFNLGADDYITKPVSGVELRARVDMRLKKVANAHTSTSRIVKRGLTLDVPTMKASILAGNESKPIALTAKEFKILTLLAQNEGKIYSRTDLVKLVWGGDVHVRERTVDSHIFGLRKKLESYANLIECIPSAGYRFTDGTDSEQST